MNILIVSKRATNKFKDLRPSRAEFDVKNFINKTKKMKKTEHNE